MTALPKTTLHFAANPAPRLRQRLALADLAATARLWRLCLTLAWLDIRLRYRGSLLGPFWLTLSTGVMVAALGVVYSTLFVVPLHSYLPFLSLSLVLWNGLANTISDACSCFISAEGMVRAMRMPFTLHAARCVLRNLLVLLHNVPVVVVVFAIFSLWPGLRAVLCLPGLLLWVIDGIAACLFFGAVCARFRDIPPIVSSVIQIAFFVSAVMWQPSQLGARAHWLVLNPFFTLLEVVRAPLLGEFASEGVWISALGYSFACCLLAWLAFARVRGRIAFWV